MPGDVDVLVVGQPDRDDVYEAAERAQIGLCRPANTTIVLPLRWSVAEEPFLREFKRRSVVAAVGQQSPHDVGEGA